MLRFIAPNNSTSMTQRVLPGAYLIGPDSVPIAGEVVVEDGAVRCEKGTREAAAVALQMSLDEHCLNELGQEGPVLDDIELRPLGVLTLQTCLLPDRKDPYILTLELARHRIMLFLTKLEEWQAFDLPTDSIEMRLLDRARDMFTKALVLAGEPDSVDETMRLGFLSLWIAIEASERLTMRQALRDTQGRIDGSLYESIAEDSASAKRSMPVLHPGRGGVVLPTRPAIGASVSPTVMNDATKKGLIDSCDFITMPMRWIEMEPIEGEYAYTPTDRWIEWAIRQAKLPVVAGPVVDFRPHCVPEWLYIWENDYDTLRDLVYEHMKAVVTRYRRTVSRWTVCSGLHCGDHFKLDFQQMIDLTRISVLVVRKLHPRARVQVEIVQPWGGYHTSDRRSLPPLLYAEMLTQSGVPIDAFSLRVQMGSYKPGQDTHDLMAFSSMLDQYAMLDRPISISGLGCPSEPQTPSEHPEQYAETGRWRSGWSDEAQADWLSAYASVALSKPYIESVCWHEFADPAKVTEMRSGGVMNKAFEPKPALARMRDLHDSLAAGRVPQRVSTMTMTGQVPAEAAGT
ncbi:MAG: endo-1,4-beta-xylanase [Phycisphaerales bacterium JB052]